MSRSRRPAQVSTTIMLEGVIDIDLEVSASVTPYIGARMPSKGCECGEPPEGGDIEDLSVTLNGLDVLKQLTPEQVEKIEEHIYEEAENQDDGPDPDAYPKWERDLDRKEREQEEKMK